MKKLFLLLVAVLAIGTGFQLHAQSTSARQSWTVKDGGMVRGRFVRLEGNALILDKDGTEVSLSLSSLSVESVELAKNLDAARAQPSSLSGNPAGSSTLQKWENREGKVLEASFEGMDGPDQVLLRLPDGIVHRYPLRKLADWCQRVARAGGNAEVPDASPRQVVEQKASAGVSVLVIGDSMSLGGFGKGLDNRLRESPLFGDVSTFIACGTHPLSWLKVKPYTNAKTHCGYWSIESSKAGRSVRETMDVYGMTQGHKPSAHAVPKLENLLEEKRPEMLVIQLGNNLFELFKDKKTVLPEVHARLIKTYVEPMIATLVKHASPLRKIVWVSPPQAGCVSEEVQAFIHDQLCLLVGPESTVIDSRTLTHYPYPHMGPDKEHFWGNEADKWAEGVYALVENETARRATWRLPSIVEKPVLAGGGKEQGGITIAKAIPVLELKARLVSKTAVPEPESFAPYRECMVAYKYQVEEVVEGEYLEKEILIMHPAYIHRKAQKIEQSEIGKVYDLQPRKLDAGSLWGTVRCVDDSATYDLDPYLLCEDEFRHPDAKNTADASSPMPCCGAEGPAQ